LRQNTLGRLQLSVNRDGNDRDERADAHKDGTLVSREKPFNPVERRGRARRGGRR